MLTVDGERYDTAVRGTVRDLVERRPVEVTPCRDGRTVPGLDLSAGPHEIEAGDAGPLTTTEVTLALGAVPERAATGRDLRVRDWLGDRREVLVGPGAASYLTTHENHNDGWKATLDGEELTPLRLDGWQQGWLVPAGEGGTVKLSYGPATTYDAALIASGAGIVALAGLLLWRRRAENPDGPAAGAARPGRVAGRGRGDADGRGDRGLVGPAGPGPGAARPAPAVPCPRWPSRPSRGGPRGGGGRGRRGDRGREGVRTHGPGAGPDRPVRGAGDPGRGPGAGRRARRRGAGTG